MPTTEMERPATGASTSYDELIELVRSSHLLGTTVQLMNWDQEVKMPPKGVAFRSKQLAMLARLHHEMATDDRIHTLLAECEADGALTGNPISDSAVNIREIRRVFDRRTKLPASLVEEEARLVSIAQHEWAAARKESNFKKFEPHLQKNIDLLRRKADCYGWADGGEPWDALAEDYEPGCTAADVERVFNPLQHRLQGLLDDLMGSATSPSNAFNEIPLPVPAQREFVEMVIRRYGFDFERGRLDTSTHPFCSGTHCNDIRLTTRFHENNLNDALGSTMHEAGHGMYEQGLLEEHIGTPVGESVSLGIHESQSRMWENQVGRSLSFWKWCLPELQSHFGKSVETLTLHDVYGGSNIVKPDFIRVEADEATYNMHIMIRFEIERAVMRGDLNAADIPPVWNEKYKEYLNLDVPNDAKGCLQDIHWSMASMGYFPTYTLGNLYAAQFFAKAKEDMPDLDAQFEAGEFSGLLNWLNTNIHAPGQRYRAADLCEHVTGKPLSADPLMEHLESKLRPLYGL